MDVPEKFAYKYDLNRLQFLTPRGHTFSLYVAPQYRYHYEEHQYEPFSADLIGSIARGAQLFLDICAHMASFRCLLVLAIPHSRSFRSS
jgi:hypothetical protein